MMTHPAIKGSEFYIEQTNAQKDQALSKLLPQVSAVGNLSRNAMTQDQVIGPSVDSSYKSTRGILQAKQMLFDMPSFKRWEGSKLAILQSEQELGVARMSITADLIDQYLKALEAEDKLQYLQGEKALTEGDMNRISRMRKMQMAKVTDLYEVEAYYQALLTDELEAIGERDIAFAKLRETTGIAITSLQKLGDTDLPAVAGNIDQWVGKGISSHPSLLAMNYAVEGAEKLVESARAEHWPQLSLQISETYANNGGYDNRQLPRYNVGTIGIQASIPIYAGGGIKAGARDARARYNQALEKRNAKAREIEKEIRAAYVQTCTSHARIQSTGQEVQAREKSRDAMGKSYELGIATIVDFLKAKKNLLKTRFEHAQSRYEFIRSMVTLKLWSGSLDERDVEEINRSLQHDRSNTAAQTNLALTKDLFSGAPKAGKPAAAPHSEAATTVTPQLQSRGQTSVSVSPLAGAQTSVTATTATTATTAATATTATTAATAATAATATTATTTASSTTTAVVTAPAAKEKLVVTALKPAPLPNNSATRESAENSEKELTKTILDWAAAWSAKDFRRYLTFYAKDFKTPDGESRNEWEAIRHERIAVPKSITVAVKELHVKFIDDSHAKVTFHQTYHAPHLHNVSSKTLMMVKSGGNWLIQEEPNGK